MRIACATLAFVFVLPSPVFAAGDPTVVAQPTPAGQPTVAAQMKAAQAGVQSFRMQLTSPAGMSGIGTFVTSPKRMHMEIATGPITIEMYVSDGYSYQNIAKSGWKKQALPPDAALVDVARAFDGNTAFIAAPDVVDAGITYGSITMQLANAPIAGVPASPPLTITCSYDKKTMLMHVCTSPFATETFLGYNDPANVISLPPELATAVDVGPVFPVASPPPAAAPVPVIATPPPAAPAPAATPSASAPAAKPAPTH